MLYEFGAEQFILALGILARLITPGSKSTAGFSGKCVSANEAWLSAARVGEGGRPCPALGVYSQTG